MKKVQITETVLRDANQSLMATRLPYSDFAEILPEMNKAGYYSVECWGGATFDSCLRYLGEDPWQRLRDIRKAMPDTKLQMLLRGQNLLGYKHYHDDVVEKFVELSIKNGIDILRIFDALNDFRNIATALEATKKYATKNTVASGCISYTQSPVHTVEKYVEMCKELKNMGFDTICLKDMAGTMSPYEAEHLIKGIKDAVGDVPLILHTHCTTGMAYMTVTKAIESGIDVIDCATSCFSNGTSQPSTETMFYALGQYGIETGLNEKVINEVNDFFKPVKQKYVDSGRINAKSMATDAQALVYKVPGGMLSNMIANLTDMKAMDKFEAALAEIPAVRKDLGYPPLVTPLSQMVGNQAVTNVLMGERYKIVSKEVQNYFRGQYGIAPAPVSESLQAKILGEGGKPVDCRIEDAKRTGEDFKKAKEALGLRAEVNAGGDAHMGLFQNVKGQGKRVAAQAAGIDQRIEGTFRLHGDTEPHAAQFLQHKAPPFVVHAAHAGNLVSRKAQGRDTRPLRRRIGRDEAILHDHLHGAHKMFRHDKVAQPPAGHGECLGKTVDNHRVVREFQHGVFRSSAVGQTVIDFIGYHQRSKFGQSLHAFRFQQNTGGVAR